MAFHRMFRSDQFLVFLTRFQDVQSHHVARRIVQHQRQEVEVDHAVQPLRQVVKQRRKIALLRNRFAHFQQSFQLAPGVFERGGNRHFRRRNRVVRHSWQNNTRIAARSTKLPAHT